MISFLLDFPVSLFSSVFHVFYAAGYLNLHDLILSHIESVAKSRYLWQ